MTAKLYTEAEAGALVAAAFEAAAQAVRDCDHPDKGGFVHVVLDATPASARDALNRMLLDARTTWFEEGKREGQEAFAAMKAIASGVVRSTEEAIEAARLDEQAKCAVHLASIIDRSRAEAREEGRAEAMEHPAVYFDGEAQLDKAVAQARAEGAAAFDQLRAMHEDAIETERVLRRSQVTIARAEGAAAEREEIIVDTVGALERKWRRWAISDTNPLVTPTEAKEGADLLRIAIELIRARGKETKT